MAVNIVFVRESASGERRVALTPETAKKLAALGATILIERGAGVPAHFRDEAYANATFTDDGDAVPVCDVHNRVHLATDARVMHRQDRACARADHRLDATEQFLMLQLFVTEPHERLELDLVGEPVAP